MSPRFGVTRSIGAWVSSATSCPVLGRMFGFAASSSSYGAERSTAVVRWVRVGGTMSRYLSCAGFSSRTGRLFKKGRQADDEDSVVSRKTEIMDWWTKRAGAFGEAS